jgi:outer membrane immunogenic protein
LPTWVQGDEVHESQICVVFLEFGVVRRGANAADIPAPAPATAPVYVPPRAAVYNWTGFYVGAMGGYGWSNSQGNDLKGGFAGGTIGYNAQFGNFVVGVEGEGAWADINQSASFLGLVTATDRIQAFGSLTGRAGVALDNVLIYGKGGGAVASNKISVNVLGLAASDTQTHWGYTVGGGVEWGFAPNWSVKGEYLWAHYESQNYFASQFPPGFASGTFDVNTVKLGVNYRFGWNAAPVTARY